MNWKRKAPKRRSRQAQGIMKYKTTVTPAMTEKTVSCPSAAAGVEGEAGNVSSKITTHAANKHEETVAVSSEVIKAGPALEVDESVDELENQLMQMFNSSDDATNDPQCAYKAYYHISLIFCFLDFRNNFYCFQSVYI